GLEILPVSHEYEMNHGMTLDEIEQMALANNPAIQQASASAHKAMGYRDQVGKRPNPTIGYNGSQLADVGTDQHSLYFEQEFVRADKLSRNEFVLQKEVQSQLWEVETQRYRVITDVRLRFYEALAAQRRLELAAEFYNVAEKGVQIAKARQKATEGTRPEVLQAEIQLKQIVVQRRQAEVKYRGAWKQLMAMAGNSEIPPGQLIGVLPDSADSRSWDLVEAELLATSPELQAARARVARARAHLDRQQVQAVPNVTLMLGAGVDNATNNGFINTQIGVPIPVNNKNTGNISAAYAEVCRASQDVRRIELAIKSRLAKAGQDYDSAAVAVEQYEKEILPRAQETLDLTESAYSAGEFSFLQTLVVRRTFFETKLEYVAAQTELAQTQALIDGLLLSGGLNGTQDTEFDSSLRDQSLGGQ
ncbi:MAG TPA: TolC family protein, partial [Planctomycetaceae bacterium]|nr:TolC family protein [Planctomycetaceae bacterium]